MRHATRTRMDHGDDQGRHTELEMVLKRDAKPVLNMTFRVSQDGSTLTQISETIGTNEKTRIVYDRQ